MSIALDLSDKKVQSDLIDALGNFEGHTTDLDSVIGLIDCLKESGFGIVRLTVAPEIEAQERDSDPEQYFGLNDGSNRGSDPTRQ